MPQHPAIQELLDRILPPLNGHSADITSPYGARPRKSPGSDPHRGLDFNYGGLHQTGENMQHPPFHSPIDGVVTNVEPKFGLIAIRDKDGFSVEIFHTQTQRVEKG